MDWKKCCGWIWHNCFNVLLVLVEYSPFKMNMTALSTRSIATWQVNKLFLSPYWSWIHIFFHQEISLSVNVEFSFTIIPIKISLRRTDTVHLDKKNLKFWKADFLPRWTVADFYKWDSNLNGVVVPTQKRVEKCLPAKKEVLTYHENNSYVNHRFCMSFSSGREAKYSYTY